MRTVIFLTIVGVVLASDELNLKNLCSLVEQEDIDKAWSVARTAATAILGGSCPSFDLDTVAFSGHCRSLVEQATCYGIQAEKRYDVEVVDYGLLADDLDNIESLGNRACADVKLCFRQVRKAIKTCMKENPNFVDHTIEAAETAYKKNFEAQVKDFADSNRGSLLGDLASMAMDQFSSADDIRTFIESHISDKVVADADAAGNEALRMAKNWCDSDCTSKSATFFKGIFAHMNGGGCDDASVFCGKCQSRAASYFAKNTLPCCIEKAVQKGIEAYDYVVENYSDTLDEIVDDVKAGLSATAIAEAEAARDSFVEQFSCVRAVYNTHQPECPTSA